MIRKWKWSLLTEYEFGPLAWIGIFQALPANQHAMPWHRQKSPAQFAQLQLH